LAGSLRIPWENLDGRVNSRWPFRSLGSHVAYLFRARPESWNAAGRSGQL